MSAFTAAELEYLTGERRLARLATVGADGTPHVAPIGMWSIDPATDAVVVRGHSLEATKKYRDAARRGRAAIVVDDVVMEPWHPRGVEVRGRAEVIGPPEASLRIIPERVISWGLDPGDDASGFARDARSVAPRA